MKDDPHLKALLDSWSKDLDELQKPVKRKGKDSRHLEKRPQDTTGPSAGSSTGPSMGSSGHGENAREALRRLDFEKNWHSEDGSAYGSVSKNKASLGSSAVSSTASSTASSMDSSTGPYMGSPRHSELFPEGITYKQVHLCRYLLENRPGFITQRGLAKVTGYSKNLIVRGVRLFEKVGLIQTKVVGRVPSSRVTELYFDEEKAKLAMRFVHSFLGSAYGSASGGREEREESYLSQKAKISGRAGAHARSTDRADEDDLGPGVWGLTEERFAEHFPCLAAAEITVRQIRQIAWERKQAGLPIVGITEGTRFAELELESERGMVNEKTGEKIRQPAKWFYSAIRRSGYFRLRSDLTDPQDAVDQEIRIMEQKVKSRENRLRGLEEGHRRAAYLQWLSELTEDQKRAIVAVMRKESGGGFRPESDLWYKFYIQGRTLPDENGEWE